MKITELTSYKQHTTSLKMITLSTIVIAFITVIGLFIYFQSQISQLYTGLYHEMTTNQWILNPKTGAVYNVNQEAVSSTSKEIEYKHHVEMVYKSFYEFTPYDNFMDKLNKGLYLVSGEVGDKIIKTHDNSDIENKIKSEDMHLIIEIDSILIDSNLDKISGIAFAKQQIIKKRGKGLRHLDIEFTLEPLSGRSETNPHGVVITSWRVINNEVVKVSNLN